MITRSAKKDNQRIAEEIKEFIKIHNQIFAEAPPNARKRFRQASRKYAQADMKWAATKMKYKQAGIKYDEAVRELEKATKMLERTANTNLRKILHKSHRRLSR